MSEFYEHWEIPKEKHLNRIMTTLNLKESVQERIAYLATEIARFKQKGLALGEIYPPEVEYAMKWSELEIFRLREFKELEPPSSNLKDSKAKEEHSKHKDLTLVRATLALNYLLTYTKVNAHNTEKAKFISFLTGFSENTIRQKISRLHEKADLNFIDYEKDLRIVRKCFETLGLDEVTKMIDNDLADSSKNL